MGNVEATLQLGGENLDQPEGKTRRKGNVEDL